MATSTDSRPSNGASNPETNSAEPSSGFTAVNGRSPPGSSHSREPSQPNGHNIISDLDRRDSYESNGKRKHSSAEQSPDSATSQYSNKRARSPNKSGQSDSFLNSMVNGSPDGQPQLPSQNDQWNHHPPQHYSSDAQFAEALQRGTQEMSPPDMGHHNSSPQRYVDHPQAHMGMNHVPAPGSITPAMAAPMIAKQRKRNFSNRTKTGCLTCRERKKKCDEGKPTCNNCERGGFLCKGYAQTGSLYKAPSMTHPAPIQAKNGYYDTPPQQQYSYQARPVPTGPPEMYETSPTLAAASRGRPSSQQQEHERDNRAIPHPDPSYRGQYPGHGSGPGPSWPPPEQNRRPFPTEPGLDRPNYNQVPQFPGMGRAESNPKLPPPAPLQPPMPRQGSHSMDAQGVAQLALQQQQPHQAQGQVQGQNQIQGQGQGQVQGQAQIQGQGQAQVQTQGQSHIQPQLQSQPPSQPPPPPPPPPQAQARPPPVERTEKDKMLHGLYFNHLDPVLKEERRKCKIAMHKFNRNAIEQPQATWREQFREILEPRRSSTASSPASGTMRNGRLGDNVEIEAPFRCEYGYNIELADEVEIGANVTIIDSAKVFIGKRTIIGHGVTINTEIPQLELPHEEGAKRQRKAKPIHIENDVYIGPNSVIRPPTTIGDALRIQHGTNILSGSLVSEKVTVQNYLIWDHDRGPDISTIRPRQNSSIP